MLRHILTIALASSSLAHAAPALIPQPSSLKINEGIYQLPNRISYVCPSEFRPSLTLGLGRLQSPMVSRDTSAAITVIKDGSLSSKEAYKLQIKPTGVQIMAKTSIGVYYATQTLLQLLPTEAFKGPIKNKTLPAVSITDSPRFPWRGLMLDSSRHFQTVDEVKRFIDLMSFHKLNVFHWHLTDGHGWRFESKKHPNLTKKGAWRMQPGYPEKGQTNLYGGYYTQEQMKEVVAYAKQRHIIVVPEIDMPGHCFAAVSAYPKFGCLGTPQKLDHFFTYPADAQRFPKVPGTDVLCVGKDSTIQFCKDILDEVMQIFPSRFIHIGGDEVNKKYWKVCKQCETRQKRKGLKNEHELQSWFIQQLDAHITGKGRRLIGWDEILEGGLAQNATVMSWQGEQGGIKAAKMHHDVVMSPQNYIYFDHGQSHNPLEPAHWPGHNPLEHVYNYEPVPSALTKTEAKHILGVQANVWTVFVHEQWLLDLQTWPRAAALAEVAWSPKASRNWKDFHQRLSTSHRKRLDNLGVNYWWETSQSIGSWKPSMLKPNDQTVNLEWDITELVNKTNPGEKQVTLRYRKGANALSILSVSALENGKTISKDKHQGITGSNHQNNHYTLNFTKPKNRGKYTLRVHAFGSGGADSYGELVLSSVETKQLR